MTKVILYLVIILVCSIFRLTQISNGTIVKLFSTEQIEASDTLEIDVSKSKIRWRGTKMMGLGKHEGEIEIKNGFLLFQKNTLSGGKVSVEMETITITDIPKTDPIPIRNLTNHLKSPEFFDAESHPLSHFQITKVLPAQNGTFQVSGILTLKGISKPISFEAEKISKQHFSAGFEINRFDWDIAYSGSWVDRTLVDKEIQLWIELVCK
jgi:polyisoprenoid-binding protein YceI